MEGVTLPTDLPLTKVKQYEFCFVVTVLLGILRPTGGTLDHVEMYFATLFLIIYQENATLS